ncbi:hypothetical protein HanIR_Chr14g0688691 [Helianthus annuus]|nr:hypothetical protein HanIR_Chr14g0688691 [Helianthus annuus]
MVIRSDRHSFGMDVFVYDGFEVFRCSILKSEKYLNLSGCSIERSFDRMAIRPARHLSENKFTAGWSFNRMVFRSDDNPLETDDL